MDTALLHTVIARTDQAERLRRAPRRRLIAQLRARRSRRTGAARARRVRDPRRRRLLLPRDLSS